MRPFQIYSFLIFVITAACVDPFNTEIQVQKKLVVDGLITDQPGPHTVRLSYSSKLGVNNIKTDKVTGAQVSIIDSDGNVQALSETVAGVYQTTNPGFKALAGKTYSLQIAVGKNTYVSDPENYEDPGQLSRVYFEFNENLNGNRFNIYVDAIKTPETNGLMRWRWNTTYRYHAFPALHLEQGALAPRPCSGVLSNPFTPCICCDCWASETSLQISIYDGGQSVDNHYDKVLTGTFLVQSDRFEEKSYIEMEQLSLTPKIYNFWKLVLAQQTGASSLFQPASVKIRGNVHSTTDPNEEVLGIFGVSAVIKKSIFIYRADIPQAKQPAQIRKTDDCRIFYPETTNVRPPFW